MRRECRFEDGSTIEVPGTTYPTGPLADLVRMAGGRRLAAGRIGGCFAGADRDRDVNSPNCHLLPAGSKVVWDGSRRGRPEPA